MKILSVSIDQKHFDETSDCFMRATEYAQLVSSYTVICFSAEPFDRCYWDSLRIVWTNSSNKALFIIDAIKTVVRKKLLRWVSLITCQDPFETGFIWSMLKIFNRSVKLHIQDHGNFFVNTYWRWYSWLNLLRYSIWRFVLHYCDAVRTVSNKEKEYLEKIYTVPVTFVPIYTEKQSKAIYENRIKDDFTMIMVCRLVKAKNLLLALEIMKALKDTQSSIQLRIVWDWPQRKLLEKYIQSHWLDDIVTLVWRKDNTQSEYENASLYLSTSWSEWRWRSIIEAASYGIPSVITDTWCAGDFVTQGKEWYIIDNFSKEKFVKSIIDLYNDAEKLKTLWDNAHKKYKTLLTKEETLKIYLQSWKSVFYNDKK